VTQMNSRESLNACSDRAIPWFEWHALELGIPRYSGGPQAIDEASFTGDMSARTFAAVESHANACRWLSTTLGYEASLCEAHTSFLKSCGKKRVGSRTY
jgi:hypothetical protein